MLIKKVIKKLLPKCIVKRLTKLPYIIGNNSVVYKEGIIQNNLEDNSSISIGKNTHIRGEIINHAHGGIITIGDYCYIGKNTFIIAADRIKIGNRVLIAHNCTIIDSNTHPLNSVKRHQHFKDIITTGHPKEINLEEKEVIIKDDAWIGANSVILKGVTIGEGAIVGAGSLVSKDVDPFTIAAGNPAKFIKIVN